MLDLIKALAELISKILSHGNDSPSDADIEAAWLRKRIALSGDEKKVLAYIEEASALTSVFLLARYPQCNRKLARLQQDGFINYNPARDMYTISREYANYIPVLGDKTTLHFRD